MKDKLKILYLINHAGAGGTEQYVKLLVNNLDIEPILCYNEEGLLVSELESKGIKCIKLKMHSPFDIVAASKLSKIIKENEVDIVHSQFLRENYIAVLAKMFGSKAKIVYTCHFNQYDSFAVSMMNRIFYRYLTKVISISSAVTDSLIKSGTPDYLIELVYHGVDIKKETAPLINMKEKFGVVNNNFVISSGSRFAKGKGNEFLIRSIKKLKKMTDKKFVVLLANEGETLEECKKLVNDLGLKDIVKFLGYLKTDISDLYLASDIYVTCSNSEGLGLATIESLSYGVPNVVTAVGGLKDIVNDFTICGISIPYDDEDTMAAALYKIMNDDELRKQYSVNAKKAIEDKFNINKMMSTTMDIYNDALIVIEEEV